MILTEYQAALKNNTQVLSNCLSSRSVDVSNVVFYEGVTGKDLSFDKLASKMYDILACCAIGALPSVETTGADGFIWFKDGNELEPIETKLCAIERKNIFVGPRGGLYWSSDPENAYNKAGIRSYFSGKFDSNMTDATMETKARWTSLVCFDRDTNSIIDAWILRPTIVLNELKQRQHNSSMTLKLSCFIDKGCRMKTTVSDGSYFDWERTQVKLAKQDGRVTRW